MGVGRTRMPTPWRSLSARLLVLTVGFVMLAEVFIYAPSVATFRYNYLQNRIADANIAVLALLATPDNMVGETLTAELLEHAGAYIVGLEREDGGKLILQGSYTLVGMNLPEPVDAPLSGGNAPGPTNSTTLMADATVRLGEFNMFGLIADAFVTLWQTDNRLLHVIGPSPTVPGDVVDILIDEAPLRAEMLDFSQRILALSIIISLFTATLVFLSLHWLMVRPMRRIGESLVAFRENPEDFGAVIAPSARRDEVGIVERELTAMQTALRESLSQKSRLATLGTAVGKISHDLRNMLTTARLISDSLAESADPRVRGASPRLMSALDRAVDLCTRTLDYTNDGTPRLTRRNFALKPFLKDIGDDLLSDRKSASRWHVATDSFDIFADRDQLYRVISNIALNALQAGATWIEVEVQRHTDRIEIDIGDNGPGLPPRAQENLFRPFAGSARPGGSGLGLAIAREIMRAHGGDVSLVTTCAEGTTFRLVLPVAELPSGVRPVETAARPH
jgi:signal transduction histidine kinase